MGSACCFDFSRKIFEQRQQGCFIRCDVVQFVTEIIKLLQALFVGQIAFVGDVVRSAGEMIDRRHRLAQPPGHEDGCDGEILVMIDRH